MVHTVAILLFLNQLNKHIMYHYQVYNSITGEVILDSSKREEFDGYLTEEKAYMVGLGSKNENRLSDLHLIKTFKSNV